MLVFLILILTSILVVIAFKLKKSLQEIIELRKDNIRFSSIKDLDIEKNKLNKEIESIHLSISKLRDEYAVKKSYYDTLITKISLYEDQLDAVDYGLYEPIFSFDTSEKYKSELVFTRQHQKELINNHKAAICTTNWTVNNSAKEGKRQTDLYHKLMLRAFNGECDSIISTVKWNNANKSIEKLEKAFESINKIANKQHSYITDEYKNIKINELKLKFEYEEKLNEEKEEQRRIKEEIKEEERAVREFEKAIKEAETEEIRYQKALEDAKSKLSNAHGAELDKLTKKMQQLEFELEEARKNKERALSMAQQTKCGHIYVISNIGSFGENIYKIGMTRRLEPLDRVRELSGASVPFEFDVHGVIFSENAPEFENLLHKEFSNKRVNMVNSRKEFFNVKIHEIEEVVKKYNAEIELTKIAEARQYRESIIIRNSPFENTINIDNFSSINDEIPQMI